MAKSREILKGIRDILKTLESESLSSQFDPPGLRAVIVHRGRFVLANVVDEDGLRALDGSVGGVIVPDFRDEGTVGHLLGQVRRAWSDPLAVVCACIDSETGGPVFWVELASSGHTQSDAATEEDALLAARKAAPK